MAKDLYIRKAEQIDLTNIIDIINESYRVTVANTGDAFKARDRFQSEDQARDLVNLLWVGELDTEIVGVVGAKVTGNFVYIGPLAVSSKHQKMGIGGKLLDFAEGRAEIAMVQAANLRCPSVSVYERRGYKKIKELPVAQLIPGHMLTRSDFTIQILQKS
jgi:predicted N-acetyltransferase YhbS